MIVFYCIVIDFNVLYRIVPNCFVYCALHVHIVLNLISDSDVLRFAERAHGVVVSHPLRMRKALGSIPSVLILDQPPTTTMFENLPAKTPTVGLEPTTTRSRALRSAD